MGEWNYYLLIDALNANLKIMYEIDETSRDYDYYINRIKYEEVLLKKLETLLGE